MSKIVNTETSRIQSANQEIDFRKVFEQAVINMDNIQELKEMHGIIRSRIIEVAESTRKVHQQKLDELKAEMMSLNRMTSGSEGGHRRYSPPVIPLVNPENHNQSYRLGKRPKWVTDLMAKTGKNVDQLRKDAGHQRHETVVQPQAE